MLPYPPYLQGHLLLLLLHAHHHVDHLTLDPCLKRQVHSEPSLPFLHHRHGHEFYSFPPEDQMPFLPNQQLRPYQQQDYPIHLDLHFRVEQDIHQVEQDILQLDLGILLLVEGNRLVEMGNLLVGMNNLVLVEVGIHCSVSALQEVDVLLLGVDIQDLVVGIPLSWVGVLHPVGDMAQMIVCILVQEGTGDKPEVGRVLGGSLSPC